MTDRRDNLSIYQTRLFPPHFKVIIEDTVWNLKPVSWVCFDCTQSHRENLTCRDGLSAFFEYQSKLEIVAIIYNNNNNNNNNNNTKFYNAHIVEH